MFNNAKSICVIVLEYYIRNTILKPEAPLIGCISPSETGF